MTRPRPPALADLQLVAASGLAGVAGAAFVIMSERALGLDRFAPLAQLWTIWSISAACLMFAYQQWAIGVGVGRDQGPVRALRGAPFGLAVAAVAGTGLAATVARTRLFHTASWFWPAAAALVVVGTIAGGLVRGQLAVSGRHRALAVVIGAENLIRVGLAVALLAAGADVRWYAGALLAGYAILAVAAGHHPHPEGRTAQPATTGLPEPAAAGPALRQSVAGLPEPAAQQGIGGSGGQHADEIARPQGAGGAGNGALGAAAAAGLLAHVALAGAPLLVAAGGGSAHTVSTLFVVLTAIRLPHLVLQAGAPRAGVVFHRWIEVGHHHRLERTRLVVLGATVAVAVVAAGAGAAAGDLVVGTMFGIRGEVDHLSYALMAAAGVLSVGANFATVLLVARGANRFLVSRWLTVLVVSAGAALAAGLTSLRSIALGLVLVHLVVLAALTAQAPPPGPARLRAGVGVSPQGPAPAGRAGPTRSPR